MVALGTSIDLLAALSDETRVRILALLEGRELTVAELTETLELPQSRVSTHLGRLREQGLLVDRRAGTSTYYARAEATMPQAARRIWDAVRSELSDDLLAEDRERCDRVLAARRNGKRWPDSVAGEMDRHYSPGRTWESAARALLGLVRAGDVLDIGAGDGAIAEMLAPRAKSITMLDRSDTLIAAAEVRMARLRKRHSRCATPAFVVGDMHALPFPDRAFDQVLMLHVLPFSKRPREAIAEAARVLRRGGDLVVATLDAHGHGEATAAYGHVNDGCRPATLRRWLEGVGIDVGSCEVTSREKKRPSFSVVTAFGTKVEK